MPPGAVGNAVHDDAGACRIQEIEYVSEGRGEFVDIFTIEGRDKSLIQFGKNVVGHLIADTFEAAKFGEFGVDLFVIRKDLNHSAIAVYQILDIWANISKNVLSRGISGSSGTGSPKLECGGTSHYLTRAGGASNRRSDRYSEP